MRIDAMSFRDTSLMCLLTLSPSPQGIMKMFKHSHIIVGVLLIGFALGLNSSISVAQLFLGAALLFWLVELAVT